MLFTKEQRTKAHSLMLMALANRDYALAENYARIVRLAWTGRPTV